MISLCEQCRYNDWRHMQEIIDAYKAAGLERPHHIWCAATDRPEDLQFEMCGSYRPYGTRNNGKRDSYPQEKENDRPAAYTAPTGGTG